MYRLIAADNAGGAEILASHNLMKQHIKLKLMERITGSKFLQKQEILESKTKAVTTV